MVGSGTIQRHACRAGGWNCGTRQDEAAWSGDTTSHCSNCGENFIGLGSFEMHQVNDDDGGFTCRDPWTMRRTDGTYAYELVVRPTWTPNEAWRQWEKTRAVKVDGKVTRVDNPPITERAPRPVSVDA